MSCSFLDWSLFSAKLILIISLFLQWSWLCIWQCKEWKNTWLVAHLKWHELKWMRIVRVKIKFEGDIHTHLSCFFFWPKRFDFKTRERCYMLYLFEWANWIISSNLGCFQTFALVYFKCCQCLLKNKENCIKSAVPRMPRNRSNDFMHKALSKCKNGNTLRRFVTIKYHPLLIFSSDAFIVWTRDWW